MELVPKVEFPIVTCTSSKPWILGLIAAAGPEAPEPTLTSSPPRSARGTLVCLRPGSITTGEDPLKTAGHRSIAPCYVGLMRRKPNSC